MIACYRGETKSFFFVIKKKIPARLFCTSFFTWSKKIGGVFELCVPKNAPPKIACYREETKSDFFCLKKSPLPLPLFFPATLSSVGGVSRARTQVNKNLLHAVDVSGSVACVCNKPIDWAAHTSCLPGAVSAATGHDDGKRFTYVAEQNRIFDVRHRIFDEDVALAKQSPGRGRLQWPGFKATAANKIHRSPYKIRTTPCLQTQLYKQLPGQLYSGNLFDPPTHHFVLRFGCYHFLI
jgi:hypothetical protein